MTFLTSWDRKLRVERSSMPVGRQDQDQEPSQSTSPGHIRLIHPECMWFSLGRRATNLGDHKTIKKEDHREKSGISQDANLPSGATADKETPTKSEDSRGSAICAIWLALR